MIEMRKYLWSAILTGFVFLSGCVSKSDFVNNGEFTSATVYKIKYLPRGDSYSVWYRYEVKQEIFEEVASYPRLSQQLEKRLLYKKFPVVYLPDKPATSRLLITQYDFSSLDLNHPDSLKWVEEYR
jgi:hypothetical protein